MKRLLLAIAVASCATGCVVEQPTPAPTGSPPPPPAGSGPPVVAGGSGYFALVLEGVDIDPGFGSGAPPDVWVSVLVGGTQSTSSTSYGSFDPVWNEAVIVADELSFSDGVDVQVWADDGGGAALAGEIQFSPAGGDFSGATIDLGGFDYVQDARVDFQAN